MTLFSYRTHNNLDPVTLHTKRSKTNGHIVTVVSLTTSYNTYALLITLLQTWTCKNLLPVIRYINRPDVPGHGFRHELHIRFIYGDGSDVHIHEHRRHRSVRCARSVVGAAVRQGDDDVALVSVHLEHVTGVHERLGDARSKTRLREGLYLGIERVQLCRRAVLERELRGNAVAVDDNADFREREVRGKGPNFLDHVVEFLRVHVGRNAVGAVDEEVHVHWTFCHCSHNNSWVLNICYTVIFKQIISILNYNWDNYDNILHSSLRCFL